jgi:nucleoside-diphosphate-sugar epimerase
MKILITGGAGHIGSGLVKYLLNLTIFITIFINYYEYINNF